MHSNLLSQRALRSGTAGQFPSAVTCSPSFEQRKSPLSVASQSTSWSGCEAQQLGGWHPEQLRHEKKIG